MKKNVCRPSMVSFPTCHSVGTSYMIQELFPLWSCDITQQFRAINSLPKRPRMARTNKRLLGCCFLYLYDTAIEFLRMFEHVHVRNHVVASTLLEHSLQVFVPTYSHPLARIFNLTARSLLRCISPCLKMIDQAPAATIHHTNLHLLRTH